MAQETEFHVFILQEPMRLYRGSFGPAHLIEAMQSNFQSGRSTHPQDLRATVIHMAVSMFESFDVVRRLCLRRPDRLGTHVMTVDLRPGHGVCLANTGSPGHWSVWGLPPTLAGCVVDVVGIAEQ